MIKARGSNRGRVRQGDIFRDVEFIEQVAEANGVLEVSKIVFPLVVVLTQDCDLEQDFKFRWSRKETKTQDKWLLSVLVAPLYNMEHFLEGQHLSELERAMVPVKRNSTQHRHIMRNQIPRYHYLSFSQHVPIVDSVVDFKHYFSVNVETLKGLRPTSFVCSIAPLYREDISHRFAAFLSRIGLPDAV